MKFVKIALVLISFVFTTGFLPFATLMGPGLTIASSGNVYKAGAQFLIDHHIKSKTGKTSLAYVKEEVSKQNDRLILNQDLKKLVETRINIGHKKITDQNKNNNLNKDLRLLVEKRITITRKKLNIKKINQ